MEMGGNIFGFYHGFSINSKSLLILDKLRKSAHFIPVKSTYKAVNVVEIFLKVIFQLHGVPKMVISDRDVKFTSNFWK